MRDFAAIPYANGFAVDVQEVRHVERVDVETIVAAEIYDSDAGRLRGFVATSTCKAMNRPVLSVVAGSFGDEGAEMIRPLCDRGVRIRFGTHSVAGMPFGDARGDDVLVALPRRTGGPPTLPSGIDRRIGRARQGPGAHGM